MEKTRYRPEGWKTLKAKNHPLHCFLPDECVGESFEAGADAITPSVARAVYQLLMNDKYTKVEFHKDTYPEFLAKLNEFLVFIPEEK